MHSTEQKLKQQALKRLSMGNSDENLKYNRFYQIREICLKTEPLTHIELNQLDLFLSLKYKELDKAYFIDGLTFYPVPWGVERWKKRRISGKFEKTTK